MKVDVEELPACRRRLSVEAPLEVVQAAWEDAYGRVQRQARMPGFRKGRIPRGLVRRHFGDDVRREVIQQLVPTLYRQALDEVKLAPVEEPEFQDLHLEEDQPLRFTAVVEVKPTIVLGDYAGIRVRHSTEPVTDGQVQEALEELRERQATWEAVSRPAQGGDLVIADHEMTVNGNAVPSGKRQGQAFIIGSGHLLPELEEAAVGMAPGDEREVEARLAEDSADEKFRGQMARIRLRVAEVKEKRLPAMDDGFAKTLGRETLEELGTAVRAELEAERVRQDRRSLEGKVVDAILERCDFQVPEALILRQISHQIGHARDQLRRQGVDPDRVPWDYEKLTQEIRPGATRAVRRALLLEAVAEREGHLVTEEEVDAEVERLATQAARPVPALRSLLEKGGDLDRIRQGLLDGKTLDFLVNHAKVEQE